MSIEKANEIIKKLMSGELGFTIEEFKEAISNNKELNEKELSEVSGGKSPGCGGCNRTKIMYLDRDCAATVEEGSWCKSNDWCAFWDVRYKTNSGF